MKTRIGRVSYDGNGRVVQAELLNGRKKIGEIISADCGLCEYHIKLIAAAPEMYELLEFIDNYFAIKGGLNDRITTEIRKLLKKVRGEE